MNFWEIFGGGAGALIVLMSMVEVSKIKINPWSWLAKKLGKALNGEVLEKARCWRSWTFRAERLISCATPATGGNGYTGTAACYNSAKGITQAISPTASPWEWNAGITNGTFTVPSTWNGRDYSGTVYVRFCLAYTDIDNIKIYKE